ncbi:MAG: hypothetical protein EPO11_05390 [Gammaproteobacteria bacterium]|nr:MAG: hypothetical protein EPO11_05390 [Gammaproteobacteria bacterium]
MTTTISLTRAEKLILTVSGVIALAIFLVTDPVVFGTDSNAYLRYADAISRFTVDPALYSRRAGYPLLLVATLYPWTLSVIPVLAVQAVCTALIPLLIYKILRFVSPLVALCGAWLNIATLLPYSFQTYLFPDPIQVFLSILFCYAVVRYIFERSTKTMIGMFLVYLAISFFRPLFLLFYLLIVAVVAIAAWQDRKNLIAYLKPFLALTLLVGGTHVFASALDTYLYKRIGVERKTLVGKMIFLNAFTRSTGVEGAFTDGKHTTVLREKLVSFFRNGPAELRNMKTLGPLVAHDFDAYKSDPEKMAVAILNTRNNYMWGVLFNISENWFGSWEGDRLFKQVALEQYRRHPKILLNVILTGFTYYLGIRACEPPPNYSYDYFEEYKCRFWPAYYPIAYETFGNPAMYEIFGNHGIITGMRPHIFKLINPVILKKLVAPFTSFALEIWPRIYRAVLPIASFLTGLALLYAGYRILSRTGESLRSDLAVLFAVLGVFLLYSVPMFMLTDPQFRYVSAGALFLIMSGAIALRILITGFFLPKT